jgi:hypothetical protein
MSKFTQGTATKCTRASNRLKGLPPPELTPEQADTKTVRQDSGNTVSRPQAVNRTVRDSGFSEFVSVAGELSDTVTEEEDDGSGTPDNSFSSPLAEPPPRPVSPFAEPPPRPVSPFA